MFNTPAPAVHNTPADYLSSLRRTIQQSYDHAREAGATAQHRQKAAYDNRAHSRQFNVDDMVYLHNPVVKSGQSPKFHCPWKGPYRVVCKIDDVVFKIADATDLQKTQVVHIDRLKRYLQSTTSSALGSQAHDASVSITNQPTLPPVSNAPHSSSIQYFEGELQPLAPFTA